MQRHGLDQKRLNALGQQLGRQVIALRCPFGKQVELTFESTGNRPDLRHSGSTTVSQDHVEHVPLGRHEGDERRECVGHGVGGVGHRGCVERVKNAIHLGTQQLVHQRVLVPEMGEERALGDACALHALFDAQRFIA